MNHGVPGACGWGPHLLPTDLLQVGTFTKYGEEAAGLGVGPCWTQTEWYVLCPLIIYTNGCIGVELKMK